MMPNKASHSIANDGNRAITRISPLYLRVLLTSARKVMEAIPKTQHRPISISLKAVVTPRRVPFRRRYNLQKADWIAYASDIDAGIVNITPTPANYSDFVKIVRQASNKNIPRGCRTSYACGLNDQSKVMYEGLPTALCTEPFRYGDSQRRRTFA